MKGQQQIKSFSVETYIGNGYRKLEIIRLVFIRTPKNNVRPIDNIAYLCSTVKRVPD